MKRILVLVLAAAMLCTMFVACKGENKEKESITVKLTIKDGDNVLYGPSDVTVEADSTVLDVVSQFINESEETIDYETQQRQLAGKESTIIKSINNAVANGDVFWQVLVNKKTAGFDAVVEAGAEIVVFLYKNGVVPTSECESTVAPAIQTAGDGD